MTTSLILDIVLLVILVWCFIRGIRRGFILTLCSLLAVVLALAGGFVAAAQFSAPLAERIEPAILEKIQNDPAETPEKTLGLSESFTQTVRELMLQYTAEAQNDTTSAFAAAVSVLLARSILFLAGFLLIFLLWILLCHALNLVARLPVLSFFNHFLGGAAGLVEGILLLLLLRWVFCDLLGWLPPELCEESYIFSYLNTIFAPFWGDVFSIPKE